MKKNRNNVMKDSSYNVITDKYSVYFQYDRVTEEASYDDKDMKIID